MATAAKHKTLDPVADFEEPVKKQEALPGMENRGIEEIEDAARRYAGVRDKRMSLNEQEVKLKDLLLGLLKKHDKREYQHGGIRVWIKVEEETVKVKISEDDEPPAEKENHVIRDEANNRGKNRGNESRPGKRAEAGSQDGRTDHQAEGATEAPAGSSDDDPDIPF